MQRVIRPMTIGYIKQVREQQQTAFDEAKEKHRKFTAVYWNWDYTRPVMMALIFGKGK